MSRQPIARAAGPVLLALMLAVPSAPPAAAQDLPPPSFDLDEMKRQMDQVWEQLAEGMEPALRRAEELLAVLRRIDDPAYYDLPEVQPNGDILIPRKEDAPVYIPPVSEDEGMQL
ncbi:MAG: hypothetical protein AAF675_01980 [Pseudomonadota bacterium]